jgi:hypothetical protein
MSDAKVKALELHTKMLCVKDGSHKYPMCFDSAKQCALICVDEKLNTLNGLEYSVWYFNTKSFLEEVKEEINKL